MTKHAIDLTRCHFVRHTRGFRVHGTWLHKQEVGERPEPCLVITPDFEVVSHERSTPAVVPLSAAFAWTSEAHAGAQSGLFLARMGLSFSAQRAMQLAMTIMDSLGDLIAIPPFYAEAVVVADAIRTDADGKQHHAEIVEQV